MDILTVEYTVCRGLLYLRRPVIREYEDIVVDTWSRDVFNRVLAKQDVRDIDVIWAPCVFILGNDWNGNE